MFSDFVSHRLSFLHSALVKADFISFKEESCLPQNLWTCWSFWLEYFSAVFFHHSLLPSPTKNSSLNTLSKDHSSHCFFVLLSFSSLCLLLSRMKLNIYLCMYLQWILTTVSSMRPETFSVFFAIFPTPKIVPANEKKGTDMWMNAEEVNDWSLIGYSFIPRHVRLVCIWTLSYRIVCPCAWALAYIISDFWSPRLSFSAPSVKLATGASFNFLYRGIIYMFEILQSNRYTCIWIRHLKAWTWCN